MPFGRKDELVTYFTSLTVRELAVWLRTENQARHRLDDETWNESVPVSGV